MNVTQLRTFVTLARTLSYTETARTMYVSQPAVTQQIAKLENEIGVKLLDRSTRGVALTAAGAVFYSDCREILQQLDAALARTRRYDTAFDDTLRIGSEFGPAVTRLTAVLAEVRAAMPHLDLQLSQNSADIMLGSLSRGELDAVFTFRSKRALPAGLAFEKLFDSYLSAFMSKRARLATRNHLGVSELNGETLLFPDEITTPVEMSDSRILILHAAPDAKISYVSSGEVAATLAGAGLGIAIMPDFAFPDIHQAASVRIDGIEPIPFGVYRKKADSREKTRTFIERAKAVFANRD
jgi:DNA-binding transcriptional LysR family regulator